MKLCAECGASLDGKRSDAVYCGRNCKNRAVHRRLSDEQRRRRREVQKRWEVAHPEVARESSRRWRAAHPEQRREVVQRWSATHRAERTADQRRRRDANPEVSSGGDLIRASDLPVEWRPVVDVIRDARRALGIGRRERRNG